MKWLVLDIGGANIKAADGLGYAYSFPFALWREPDGLTRKIRKAIAEAPACDHIAVTMTGELADCFESKAAGVRFILEAVAAGSDHRRTTVYLVDGRLALPQVAVSTPYLAAASNWHALAAFAGRFNVSGPALLIDVGSTTCDVIPIVDGKPAAKGMTDVQRLLSGELLYTGVERTPVCAVAGTGPYRGRNCPIVHEVFATMRDVYVLLNQLPEDPTNVDTADGKPLTKQAACLRLGRMIGCDGEEFNHDDALSLSEWVASEQSLLVAAAIRRVQAELPGAPQRIVLSGHGEFLARIALEQTNTTASIISLSHELGPSISRCAPAHALAVIAREMQAP